MVQKLILAKKSIIFILLSIFFINTATIIVFTYVPQYLLLDLNTGKPLTQLIITIFPLTTFIFPPLYGFFSDKIQNRYIFIVIGTIGMTFTYLFLLMTQNLIILIILLFIFGFFMASSNLFITLYAELVKDDKTLISYYNAIIVGAWFVGAQFGGIFINFFGIDNLFLFIFIVSIPSVITVFFVKENRSMIIEMYQDREKKEDVKRIFNGSDIENTVSKSVFFGLFFRNFSIKPIMPILAVIMMSLLKSYPETGFLIGINFLLQFFQMLLVGRVITTKNVKSFMIIGYTLSAISIFGYIASTNFWSFLISQLLVSFSYSLHWAATITYIAQNTTPNNKGRYMGYANTSVSFGSFSGGLLFSFLIFAYHTDYYIAMYFMIIFPIISTLIILLKFKPHSKKKINSPLSH
ncbi:MAG: MFS transporter [Promethearchaeota archaeon]